MSILSYIDEDVCTPYSSIRILSPGANRAYYSETLRVLLRAFASPFRSIRNIESASRLIADAFSCASPPSGCLGRLYEGLSQFIECRIPDTAYGGKNGGAFRLGALPDGELTHQLTITPQSAWNSISVRNIGGSLCVEFSYSDVESPWKRLDSPLVTASQQNLIKLLNLRPLTQADTCLVEVEDTMLELSVSTAFAFLPPGSALRRPRRVPEIGSGCEVWIGVE